jgi:hypothetical protein
MLAVLTAGADSDPGAVDPDELPVVVVELVLFDDDPHAANTATTRATPAIVLVLMSASPSRAG